MKTIATFSIVAILTTGCATSTPQPIALQTFNTEPGIVERAYSVNQESSSCYSLGELEVEVRKARDRGVTAAQLRTMLTISAIERGAALTRTGVMAGTLSFMLIDHVYSGKPESVVDRCLTERWPLAAYMVTLN